MSPPSTAHRPRPLGLVLVVLLAAGCGSDGGSSNQKLEDAISLEGAPWVVVDVGSGRAYGLASVDDPSAYRGREMLFRRIGAGSVDYRAVSTDPLGAPSIFKQGGDGEVDANAGPATPHDLFYLAVMECTQAQWQAMAGSSPWTALSAELSNTSSGAAAHNLSLDAIDSAIDRLNGKLAGGRVRLPSGTEWEAAARLGHSNTDYHFGDNLTNAPIPSGTVATYAWTFETAGGEVGPFTVGGKQASAGGFYDLHGNVWEPIASGAVRGGSWRDVVLQARIANQNASLDASVPHPLVGLRLALDLR